MGRRRYRGIGPATISVFLGLLLLTSLFLVPGSSAVSAPQAGGSASSPLPNPWSLNALRSAPLATVQDTEPGLGLHGATDMGPTSVPSILILVSFPIQHSGELAQFLRALSDPSSPLYHHYLTAAEFNGEYGGSATVYAAATTYFQSFGVGQFQAFADRLTLTFQASPAQIQAIFHTAIDEFTSSGWTYFAPTGSPTLPAPLASAIASVEGLSSYSSFLIHAGSFGSMVQRSPAGHSTAVGTAAGYLEPVTINGIQLEYAPDFQIAYDEPSLFADSGYPTNEVIGTIFWSGCAITTSGTCPTSDLTGAFVPSDIYDFYNETLPAGEPHASVYGVPLNGAPPPGPSAGYDATGANGENTLDLEMAGSTAPGASIYNVYGPTPSEANLDNAFNYILNPTNTPGLSNVNVISNSWGGIDGNDTAWYQDLQEAQARGISVLASSGDAGDNPSSSRWDGTNVDFPSSMAYDAFGVTAVGGTTVLMNSNLELQSQVTWYISAADTADGGPAGTSGGISTVFGEPSWQLDTSANSVIGGAGRGAPDIAAIANNTLVTMTIDGFQYLASNATSGGEFYDDWGTSVAAPLEAGIVAEIDHVLAAHGNGLLGFLNPQLYALANEEYAPLPSPAITGFDVTGTYVSPLPTLPLLDVTTGANYAYAAGPGYDLVTGWGSIDAYNYTMYFLTVSSTGVYGRLSGVEDVLTLDNLAVTSYFPNGTVNPYYNASIQQNFFLANSLGAPVYWIQNVIYIVDTPNGWFMNYTGWVIFPFYGLYSSLTIYEYNVPPGQYVSLPSTFDMETALETPAGFNAQYVTFSVGANTLTLPVPGAAYIIGSLAYTYSWQGVSYTNGPFPDNPTPGGLAPQFGLVGGPSLGTGEFTSPTSGSLTARVLPYGASTYLAATTMAYEDNATCEQSGTCIDQTGELAANLLWTPQSSGQWMLGISSGSMLQGVLAYEPTGSSTYSVTYTETGLPSGTIWSVTFNSVTDSSTSSSIQFTVISNGTYSFSVSSTGYSASPASGSVAVNGASVAESIAFTSSGGGGASSGSGFLGLPGSTGYVLLAGLAIAVVVIVVVVVLVRKSRASRTRGVTGPSAPWAPPPPPYAPPPAPPSGVPPPAPPSGYYYPAPATLPTPPASSGWPPPPSTPWVVPTTPPAPSAGSVLPLVRAPVRTDCPILPRVWPATPLMFGGAPHASS